MSYVGGGTCSLTASVAATTDYAAASGSAQTFTIAQATPSSPIISNIPANPVYQDSFVATVTSSTGDTGTTSVVSSTTGVCTVAGDRLTVSLKGVGSCTLTPSVASDRGLPGGDRKRGRRSRSIAHAPVDADHHAHPVERHSGRHVRRQRQHER